EETLAAGHDVFLEIEVQGALQVKENFPEGVFIFLFPPSLEELKNRIINRGTESDERVVARLKKAKKEIEMMDYYDYVVVNDDVDDTVIKLTSEIQTDHSKYARIALQYMPIL